MHVVLASSSPRRKYLLEQINLSFDVCPSAIDEVVDESLLPEQVVMDLAELKGRDVAENKPNSLIIAADTIVFFNNQILGKPANRDEAYQMLKKLSGNSHAVYTGVYTVKTNDNGIVNSFTMFEKTIVTFGALTDEEIFKYIDKETPYDKAGSYGIQDDLGCLFVERIDGDYNNVVGFPLYKFYRSLVSTFPEVINQIF
ncbi:MAG TPA: Maf family protein [Balneolaceae bacterium]|nr:Maf family protein [Balneolaceae bacterium]